MSSQEEAKRSRAKPKPRDSLKRQILVAVLKLASKPKWAKLEQELFGIFLCFAMAFAAFVGFMLAYAWLPTTVTVIIALTTAAIVAANLDKVRPAGQESIL
jgi:hypothetical protein